MPKMADTHRKHRLEVCKYISVLQHKLKISQEFAKQVTGIREYVISYRTTSLTRTESKEIISLPISIFNWQVYVSASWHKIDSDIHIQLFIKENNNTGKLNILSKKATYLTVDECAHSNCRGCIKFICAWERTQLQGCINCFWAWEYNEFQGCIKCICAWNTLNCRGA